MLSDNVLSRLGHLVRTPVPSVPSVPLNQTPERTLLDASDGARDRADERIDQLPAGREQENAWGKHWLRERELALVWPHAERWLRRAATRLHGQVDAAPSPDPELDALLHAFPEQVVYLDLETCGFAGSMVFLIGLIHQQGGRLVLSQLLARNYAEEKPMLQTLWTIAAGKRVLATFNGKSFDWPMVHDRSTVHHLGHDARAGQGVTGLSASPTATGSPLSRHDPRPDLIHCDLLHHARRRWKHQLPDCKLQTLEHHICRRRRLDDIPGREIPTAYHDFVRHGDAWLIRGVLHHNALDLITLLQLSLSLSVAPAE